ncbi:MAG: hypothetical protein MI975_00630, partial [Cytophagales bacterium]|nr:hypothetical protein [Cytophagales bacterium]
QIIRYLKVALISNWLDFVFKGRYNLLNLEEVENYIMINKHLPEVPSCNPNQVKAAVITWWLKKYPICQVQYMTGHRYVSSTERYRTDHLETFRSK